MTSQSKRKRNVLSSLLEAVVLSVVTVIFEAEIIIITILEVDPVTTLPVLHDYLFCVVVDSITFGRCSLCCSSAKVG